MCEVKSGLGSSVLPIVQKSKRLILGVCALRAPVKRVVFPPSREAPLREGPASYYCGILLMNSSILDILDSIDSLIALTDCPSVHLCLVDQNHSSNLPIRRKC